MNKTFCIQGGAARLALGLGALWALLWWPFAAGAEAVCARVKIEIQQELTLERQAFDAVMKINNNLDTVAIENVSVNVRFTDADGNGVLATSNPNDTTARFFIRVDRLDGIADVSGNGRVLPGTTGEIHWLIIPTLNAAQSPTGTLYFVGATLSYSIGGQPETVEVTPDFITVKPLPELSLDYFLSKDVFGDEPTTPQIEPIEPYTLGVRVRNNGQALATRVRIDSAQPVIRENPQGLLIDFTLTGSSVDDQPTAPVLLIDFGDVAPNRAKMGRWQMQSTLAGEFVSFTAAVSHADELGGAATSIVAQPVTHFLVRDVLVDEPGRDPIRDFLALDGNSLRVYESDPTQDELVTDQSAAASFPLNSQAGAVVTHSLNAPATAGFMYVQLPDPYNGSKVITEVIRSDGKRLSLHNAWTSKTRDRSANPIRYEHFVNLFDSNSTGRYTVVMGPAGGGPLPPVIQGIPDKVTAEGSQVGFLISASDPNGDAVFISVAPRPVGAAFVDNGDGSAFFNWTPTQGQAGRYTLTFTATDGGLASTESLTITVNPAWDTDGDGMDDAWEMTHFGTLDRDGSGDFDGDGISDLDEFLNGTDPTQAEQAAAPQITPPGGSYSDYVTVTLSTATANANIYYSLDGSTPDTQSARYTGPITLSRNATLRAVAAGTGYSTSPVSEASYTITQGGPFQQGATAPHLLVVEAEHFSAASAPGTHSWVPDYTLDYSGDSALQALPDSGGVVPLEASPRLDFEVNFLTTGMHYIWVRGRAPNADGDMIHIGLDETLPATSDALLLPTGSWGWRRVTADGPVASLQVPSTGQHRLHIWMGEDGAIVDKILLTTDPNYIPSAAGPRESLTNSSNAVPVLQAMADRTSVRGTTVNVTVPVSDPDAGSLTYSASGLPRGLILNASTGVISGLIDTTAAASNAVRISVSDTRDSVSTVFNWTVLTQDTTVPAVTAPPDLRVEATALNTPVNLGNGSAVDDVDGNLPLTHNAPSAFPLGVTLVTYSATDSAGNVGSATQRVTVVDTTPPQLIVPNDQTVYSAEPTAVTLGAATVSDLFGPVTTAHDAPATFPLGVTVVTWTATDANGNTRTGQQRITVMAPSNNRPPVLSAPADQHHAVDDRLDLPVLASDADGDSLSFSAIGLPSGLNINRVTGLISGTLDAAAEGSHRVLLSVSDGIAPAVEASFNWTVIAIPKPGPVRYTILDRSMGQGDAWVVSLTDGNTIRVGTVELNLNRYQRGRIPAGFLAQGVTLTGTGPFDIGSSVDGTDVPLSSRLAGTQFVLPQLRYAHRYYLLSLDGNATAQITLAGVTTSVSLSQGRVVEFDAGSNNSIAAVIRADLPIMVAHQGMNGGAFIDAVPVPPAATELWGVRSNSAIVGALEDNTTLTVYADNGTRLQATLNAGQRYTVPLGAQGAQGTGSALRLVADKPIGAVQWSDGDGADQTVFMPTAELGVRFGIPTDAQYVAVVCPRANTRVTLNDGVNPPSVRSCSGDGLYPGKLYYGSMNNGVVGVPAGSYLESDQPIHLMYEDMASNDEHNLMGMRPEAYRYSVLDPSLVNGDAWVVSLMDGNRIRVGTVELNLNRYQRGRIPAGALVQGVTVTGTGPFDIGSSVDGTDVPLSSRLAGTQFVLPQLRYTHRYYLLSPDANATAQINLGGTITPISLPQGQVVEFDAGSNNSIAAVIRADLPIMVAHQGMNGGAFIDAVPVPPAATELWGVRSNSAIVGALEDNTTLTVFADNGTRMQVILNAGQQYTVSSGAQGAQGTGSALRMVANKPIGALQWADGDGTDQTVFMPTAELGMRFGIPTDAQYVTVVCPRANTRVTLNDGVNPPTERSCAGGGLYPGKLYYGSMNNAVVGVPAGASLESDQPIYVMYEDMTSNGEHNLMGYWP